MTIDYSAMEKIAFFDFCETLVDFQTADAFVHFVRNNHGNKRMNRLNQWVSFLNRTYIIVLIEKILPNRSINKRLVLRQLKGMPQDKIEKYANDYYNEMIKPHLIPQMILLLHNLQHDGYRVVLVSGGYYQYLKYFAADNNIAEDDILSTRIGVEGNVCTGRFDGRDCMGENKVIFLDKRFDRTGIQSISFSDSVSDLPFLLWTDEQYVVSRDKEQEWAKNNSFKQIVWRQKDV